MTRAAIAALVLLVAVAAGAIALDQSASDEPSSVAPQTSAIDGPTVPPADALSVAWYCAEGTSTADGRANEAIIIGNLSKQSIQATITVMAGAEVVPGIRHVTVDPLAQRRIEVADVRAAPEIGVVVEVLGGQAIVEHELTGRQDVAVGPCARAPSRDWYFAQGTSERGAEEWLALFNPFGDDAIVDITFLTDSGFAAPGSTRSLPVPRRSRVSVDIHDLIRRQERIAIAVHARVGRIVAERSLRFDGSDTRRGLAVSLGATGSASRWRVPVGEAAAGSAQSVAIANFEPHATKAQVDVLLDGDTVLEPQSVDVPARGVVKVDFTGRVPPGNGFAVVVRVPDPARVVVESFAAWATPATTTGVASSIATVTESKRWAFAIGRVDDQDDGTLSAYNVSGKPITVQLYAYTGGDLNSPKSTPAIAVPPGERAVFTLSERNVRSDQVIVVAADGPIVVGRTMTGPAGASVAMGVPFTE